MAKRFRKQISRALKRRFQQFESDLIRSSYERSYHAIDSMRLSYNEFADKLRSLFKRLAVVASVSIILITVLALSSCNVTRKVTTESSFYMRGDTTCSIVTKTIESYDATKH